MIESPLSTDSDTLSGQVSKLEAQLMLRRQRLRMAANSANRKIAAKLSSPGMLLSAVGVGVVLEQTSHPRGVSILGFLNAANSCIQLLLSFSSVTPSAVNGFTENT